MSLTKKQQLIRATILDKIYAERPISRIDIAKDTGITPATVSTITADLLEEESIVETGQMNNQPTAGRKKILLDIPKERFYFVGSEISESRFSFVLTDNTGDVITREKHYPSDQLSMHSVTDYIQALKAFLSPFNQQVRAIGVSLPGHYNQQKPDEILTNNKRWEHFNLKTLQAAFSQPMYFDNNVNAMTIAKRLFTTDIQSENFIYFHVGHGMHYSYMFENKLYRKDNFLIGEMGHTIVNPEGELCECGKYGCLQTYASETWLMKKARLVYDANQTTFLRELSNNKEALTMDDLLTAAKLGDRTITTLLHQAIKYLAVSLTNLNMMIDAEKVYVHGKLFKYTPLIDLLHEQLSFKPLLKGFEQRQDVLVEPYNSFNGAVGGAAIAITYDLIAFPHN